MTRRHRPAIQALLLSLVGVGCQGATHPATERLVPWDHVTLSAADARDITVEFALPSKCSAARATSEEGPSRIIIGVYLRSRRDTVDGQDCSRQSLVQAHGELPASLPIVLQEPVASRQIVDKACSLRENERDARCRDFPQKVK